MIFISDLKILHLHNPGCPNLVLHRAMTLFCHLCALVSCVSVKDNNLGDKGTVALGQALLSNVSSQIAFITCDKFSTGPEDQSLDLKGKGLNVADATLLAGVLKSKSLVTSIE